MFKKLKTLIAKVRYYFSYNACYNEMESRNVAAMSRCCGVSGGDNNSGYLNYNCINCPYLCLVDKEGVE